MKSATLDSKRRLVMPADCPPKSLVTIHPVDKNTWIIHRQVPRKNVKMVAIPIITDLPEDPEWDKVEDALGRAALTKLPPPEE